MVSPILLIRVPPKEDFTNIYYSFGEGLSIEKLFFTENRLTIIHFFPIMPMMQ